MSSVSVSTFLRSRKVFATGLPGISDNAAGLTKNMLFMMAALGDESADCYSAEGKNF